MNRQAWRTQRESDNHFYWLQVDGIHQRNLENANGTNYPASITGDIRGNNTVDVTTTGVTKVTIWLSNDLIDWSKPARAVHNHVRAMQPWPVAYTFWSRPLVPDSTPLRLIVHRTEPIDLAAEQPVGTETRP